MANLKEVKTRIQSVTSTQQITKAMKMVAAAKLRKAQNNIIQIRPYVQKLNNILLHLSSLTDDTDSSNVYNEARSEIKKVLIVVISSDRGLCGGFNNNTFKETQNLIETEYAAQAKKGDVLIMPIGKKALDYFKRRKHPILDHYALALNKISFDSFKEIAEFAMEGFKKNDFDQVRIVYNSFKNVATQILRTDHFLPIVSTNEENVTEAEPHTHNTDYLFLPSQEEIIKSLIPKSLKVTFYKAILESYASEMGARMTAMDQATDNANELIKELKLTYNRTRQSVITNEILEIVGGAEALASG